jgi:hypothetical protein
MRPLSVNITNIIRGGTSDAVELHPRDMKMLQENEDIIPYLPSQVVSLFRASLFLVAFRLHG